MIAHARPLYPRCQYSTGIVEDTIVAHKVKVSPNRATPRKDAATPRMAEEIMCVIGDVTLIERVPAMESRNPTLP